MDCRRLKLKSLNAHISCPICKGYLVDATTVIDCLHTFCKSCLLKHFEEDNRCPKCENLIHQSHPSHYVAQDRLMQDIVYKLVPKLQDRERDRRELFYKTRGLQYDAALDATVPINSLEEQTNSHQTHDLEQHRNDEQVNICFARLPSSGRDAGEEEAPGKLQHRYVRLSSHATVTILKKYLAKKFYKDDKRYNEIDILCNDELMGKDHSLKFIQKTRWRTKASPLLLQYRSHLDF